MEEDLGQFQDVTKSHKCEVSLGKKSETKRTEDIQLRVSLTRKNTEVKREKVNNCQFIKNY